MHRKQYYRKKFRKKIDNLAKNGFISEKEAERLHSIRFFSNDSIYEMLVPKERVLFVVLEIIEHLLKSLYLFDFQTKDVLDTKIKSYPEFKRFLQMKIKKFSTGDQYPLAKILDKDIRRLGHKKGDFESELIMEIKNEKYKDLKLGDDKFFGNNRSKKYQHYIINNQT